jgi:hypothetical protein
VREGGKLPVLADGFPGMIAGWIQSTVGTGPDQTPR